MSSEKRYSFDLDTIAGLVTSFLLLSIVLVVFLGNQIGIRVVAQLPADSLLGPFEAITLAFSEPVDESLAIEKFFIQPDAKGKFEWVDSKTFRFLPTRPFVLDTDYTLSFAPGMLTNNGGYLKKPVKWNFRVRAPLVVYLVASEQQSQLWAIDTESGKTKALTDETLKIFNFDTSRDGEFIIFSAFNNQNGIDLWRVTREGGNAVLLVQCGLDRCSVPAISPDGRLVAYVREAASPSPDLQFGAPRIWVFNLENRQDAQLYEDQQIIGYEPVWSPDGTRLASYDGLADEIRLLDLVTSEQLIIPSQLGSPVTWSSDGSTFVFTDLATNDFGLYTRIRQAKISINEITTMFGENDERDYYYNSLAWSPVEDVLVIGLRFEENNPAEALWLMDPIRRDGQVIADQPDYIYNTPYWDPWGRGLIFQQFKLHGVYKPEIGLLMSGMEAPQVLAEGLMPHWLP